MFCELHWGEDLFLFFLLGGWKLPLGGQNFIEFHRVSARCTPMHPAWEMGQDVPFIHSLVESKKCYHNG